MARHTRREQQATVEPIGRDVVIAIPGWRFEGCVLRESDDGSGRFYRLALWTRAAATAAAALGLMLAITASGNSAPPVASPCHHIAPHCRVRQHAVCVCADANQLNCSWICSY